MSARAGDQLQSALLLALYEHYERWAARLPLACRRGCATCCTRMVTATSLEARLVAGFLERSGRGHEIGATLAAVPVARRHAHTTNGFARLCLAGSEAVEGSEGESWHLEPCPFLQEKACSIYPVRPFGCRAFGSLEPCGAGSSAVVPPLLLTVNTVCLQLVEHLDRCGGRWGNFLEILRFVAGVEEAPKAADLLAALPLPGFLVEPGEGEDVRDFLDRLWQVPIRGVPFGDLFSGAGVGA